MLNGDVVRETFMHLIWRYPVVGQIFTYTFIALFIYVVLNVFIAIIEESFFTVVSRGKAMVEEMRCVPVVAVSL